MTLFRQPLYLLLLFLLLACHGSDTASDGRVVAVKDGDTIEVMEEGKALKVRLAEIDCPEKNQDFGTQAKKFTSELAFGKKVRLDKQTVDRYGRVVARVYLPDGRCLNDELVAQGFAWHYRQYSKNPTLDRLEADARMYRRGLWSHQNPVAPWEFRQNQRAGKLAPAPAPRQEPALVLPHGSMVWVCNSKTVKFYHLRQTCPRLERCGSSVSQLTQKQADEAGKSRLCSVCGKAT